MKYSHYQSRFLDHFSYMYDLPVRCISHDAVPINQLFGCRKPFSSGPIFGRRFSAFAASLAVSQHRGTPCSIPSFRPRVENSSIAAKAWASISLTCCRSFSSAHPFFVFSSAATTLSKKVSSSDGFIKCSIILFLYPPRKRSGGCESFFYICVLEYGDSY